MIKILKRVSMMLIIVLLFAGCTIDFDKPDKLIELGDEQTHVLERIGVYAYANLARESTLKQAELKGIIEKDLENYIYTVFASNETDDGTYYWSNEISKDTIEDHLSSLYNINEIDYSIFSNSPKGQYGMIYDADNESFKSYAVMLDYEDFAMVTEANYSNSECIYYVNCTEYAEIEENVYYIPEIAVSIWYEINTNRALQYEIREINAYYLD